MMEKETLKELIEEMELRLISFEFNCDLYKDDNTQRNYWNGKRSEASFVVEKLKLLI